jgi:16S rRNA (uracil1498-N3)-methyltransferase
MNLFYTPDIETNLYFLNEEESLHCTRVLRLRKGDTIHLTNGKGDLFEAVITDDDQKHCKVKIVEAFSNYKKRNYHLHIAIAPTKNITRFEWFLEKATEIGIDEITPLICKHSERKTVNTDRLKKIIVSAMKQSLKTYLPILNDEKRFDEFVKQDIQASKYICHYEDENKNLKDIYKKGSDAILIIGPEGDFDKTEIIKAKENNFVQINLGDNRYRTETAALMACHTIMLMNE